MKRLLFSLVLLRLLTVPAQAVPASGAVALTFDRFSPQITEALDEAGVRGTFFLREASTEAVERLTEGRHEIGLDLSGEPDMTGMSRRQIYGMLQPVQTLLPEKQRPCWLRPPGKWDGALYQVAKATRLSMAGCSLDARDGLTRTMIDQIRSGDVIALDRITGQELAELISILRGRELEPVTLSELAAAEDIEPVPGRLYQKFPARHRP